MVLLTCVKTPDFTDEFISNRQYNIVKFDIYFMS